MKIWLVTTGSSDVQLINDDLWQDWARDLSDQWNHLPFEPKQLLKDADEPYRIPPRVLGIIYDAYPNEVWEYLTLPLLHVFNPLIQTQEIDKIFLLLTDQENVFDEESRDSTRCPYWQDTCTLLPIFKRYFEERLPDAELVPKILKPNSANQGLDDWDQVLAIARTALNEIDLTPDTVYVSHQAGTPAISSAVQFVSLTRFRDKVSFLVSNEYRTEQTKLIPSSTYLRGIQVQEAIALLERFDYVGVKNLICSHLSDKKNKLLDALIAWNYAKFDDFASSAQEFIGNRNDQWWWMAYEAAYLSVVRHSQGNIVDSFFHGFRAIEGVLSEWGKHEFSAHLKEENERSRLQISVLEDSKNYFSSAKFKEDGSPKNDLAKLKVKLQEIKDKEIKSNLILFGEVLYPLFRCCKEDYKSKCPSLSEFWDSNNGIAERRNIVFHQLKGLTELELYSAWKVDSWDDLKLKMLSYLNYVTGNDFKSLEEASLMAQVHQELESAIANL